MAPPTRDLAAPAGTTTSGFGRRRSRPGALPSTWSGTLSQTPCASRPSRPFASSSGRWIWWSTRWRVASGCWPMALRCAPCSRPRASPFTAGGWIWSAMPWCSNPWRRPPRRRSATPSPWWGVRIGSSGCRRCSRRIAWRPEPRRWPTPISAPNRPIPSIGMAPSVMPRSICTPPPRPSTCNWHKSVATPGCRCARRWWPRRVPIFRCCLFISACWWGWWRSEECTRAASSRCSGCLPARCTGPMGWWPMATGWSGWMTTSWIRPFRPPSRRSGPR